MNMSEIKQIASAFVRAQKAFSPALKTATNPHFKSKYAGLDACVEAVIDALNENGIALIQETSECADGVTIETVFLHESGEVMRCGKLHVPATKQDAQGYGSALTYARRYSLMASCGIAPEDDDGNAASKAKKESLITESQAADIIALAQEVGADMTAYRKFLGVTKLDELPAAQFERAIKALESKRKQSQGDVPQ
jgi:hypothetical protein